MGTLTNATHYILHIIQLGFSTKIPITLLPNWATKLYYLNKKKPKIIYFVGKIQKAQQSPLKSSLLLGTSKSPLLYGTFKARCYTAPLKSPLPHGNIFTKSYKTQMLFWHLFYKTQYYFGTYFTKPKCYFGTYFIKPNIILTHILQNPILFWQLHIKPNTVLAHIYKAQILFLATTHKAQ